MRICRDFFIICEENERAGQGGEKKIFPAGTARALGGARLPVENIFFRILRTSQARIFPSAGKSAFFPAGHLAKHCLAGKSAFFPAERLAKHCLAGKSTLFPAGHLAKHCLAGKSALFPAVSVIKNCFRCKGRCFPSMRPARRLFPWVDGRFCAVCRFICKNSTAI